MSSNPDCEGLERLEIVDAEDNCCLEVEVGRVPTVPGVYIDQIVLKKICDLLYRPNSCETANVLGFLVIRR